MSNNVKKRKITEFNRTIKSKNILPNKVKNVKSYRNMT